MMNISKIFRSRLHSIKGAGLPKPASFCSDKTPKIEEDEIEIPKRIPRGPTDVLRALESTVGRDPTAAHYKYHDDPYLIPMSNMGKRTFAMAQEAGRKAAHWIRKEHSDLFQHKESEPPIEAFFPPMIYTEKSDVNEEDLKRSVQNAQVSDSRLIYKLLKEKNIEIDPKTEQDLLELICYQNNEDGVSEEFIEERWFRQTSRAKEKQRKVWKDGDFAEEIFIGLKEPTSEAYSAIIQGMSRYFQADRAIQLYEEATQKGIIVNTNTYNSLIMLATFLKENYEMRWRFALDLFISMDKNKLRPNLGTLNAGLHVLSNSGTSRFVKENALRLLSEFKKLGVEPSLASWYYILMIFCKQRGPVGTVLIDIMNEIEGKEHQIRDLRDTNFFVTAMGICRDHLVDVELAERVHKLLHYGNNYDLIGDSYKESIYYRHYFALLCDNIPLDDFMENVYHKLVPHIYVPEPGILAEVLKQVDLNGAVQYVLKLWSDIVIFDQSYRENLLDSITNIMVNNEPLPDSELHAKFAYVAWDIYNRIEAQKEEKTNKISLSGEILGRIMILLLRNKDFEKGCVIMDKLDKDHHTVVGVPKLEALILFVDACIENKAPSRAINCIQYCSDSGFPEAAQLAAHLNDKLTLDENYLNRLSKIIGDISLASVKNS